MPRLKLKVESTLHKYLTDELTDEGFRKSIHLILTEFNACMHELNGLISSEGLAVDWKIIYFTGISS